MNTNLEMIEALNKIIALQDEVIAKLRSDLKGMSVSVSGTVSNIPEVNRPVFIPFGNTVFSPYIITPYSSGKFTPDKL